MSSENYEIEPGFYLATSAAYGYVHNRRHWENAITGWEVELGSKAKAIEFLLGLKECDYSNKEDHPNTPPEEIACFGDTEEHTGERTLGVYLHSVCFDPYY